jgi:hypothetical protein
MFSIHAVPCSNRLRQKNKSIAELNQGLRMKRGSKYGNHGFIFFFGDLALTNLFLQVCNALIQLESPVDILCNFGA